MSAIDMWLKSRLYVLPLTRHRTGERLLINLFDVSAISESEDLDGAAYVYVHIHNEGFAVNRDDLCEAFVAAYESYNGQPDDSADIDDAQIPF